MCCLAAGQVLHSNAGLEFGEDFVLPYASNIYLDVKYTYIFICSYTFLVGNEYLQIHKQLLLGVIHILKKYPIQCVFEQIKLLVG